MSLPPRFQPNTPHALQWQTRVATLGRYHSLIERCCSSMDPHEKDDGINAFVDGCKKRLEAYPTLNDLRAFVHTNPQTPYRVPDHNAHLDLAIRLMCGWDNRPDYFSALQVLSPITTAGKYTKRLNHRFPLGSPSRHTCGRANALAAWAHFQLALRENSYYDRFPLQEMPRKGYQGPAQHEWRGFLCAVAHAADAARQRMVCPAVLEIGYRFRSLANVLRLLIQASDYISPLLLALRRWRNSEISHCTNFPMFLIPEGQGEKIVYELKFWLFDMDDELREYPDPYSCGKIGTPFLYQTINGELNE